MGKNIIQKAEEELLKGRSHQEIFNEIMDHTSHDKHKVAEAIRKIPTPVKRKKYRELNLALIFLMFCVLFANAWGAIASRFTIFPVAAIAVSAFLIYQCWKFRPNAQPITGIFMCVSLFRGFFYFNSGSFIFSMCFIVIVAAAAAIAFYLALKLPADYRMDKELLKENPEQRVNSLIFND
jgi:hypothetical protein